MGYDTTVDMDLIVREDKFEEFKIELERIKDDRHHNKEDEWFSYYYDLVVDSDRSLWFTDSIVRHFYEEEKFCEWIAPYVEEGQIECEGEDGSHWMHGFDGNSGWKEYNGSLVYTEIIKTV